MLLILSLPTYLPIIYASTQILRVHTHNDMPGVSFLFESEDTILSAAVFTPHIASTDFAWAWRPRLFYFFYFFFAFCTGVCFLCRLIFPPRAWAGRRYGCMSRRPNSSIVAWQRVTLGAARTQWVICTMSSPRLERTTAGLPTYMCTYLDRLDAGNEGRKGACYH